jgi:hypothetical protein
MGWDIEVGAFTVVFDACVLYPASLRDLLLELSTKGIFRARWTDKIHEEWITATGNRLKPVILADRTTRCGEYRQRIASAL